VMNTLYFGATTVLMTLSPVLVTLSQNSKGQIEYSIPSSTLMTELLKIGTSVAMMFTIPKDQRTMTFGGVLHFAVPAVIYFINNNLTIVVLTHVDSTTFQLISQLKIIFTGLLFRLVLKRELHFFQYCAIGLIACGTAVSQIPVCNANAAGPDDGDGSRTPWWGFILMVLSCFLSALGGIYSEKLLKGKMGDSIHWQNCQLYAWGILLNSLGTIIHDTELISNGLFTGYNRWTWFTILNNALNGLAISALLKFGDNIMRVFAHATAIVLTMFANIFLFVAPPTPQVVLAFLVIAISMVQYNSAPSFPQVREGLVKFGSESEEASTLLSDSRSDA